MDSPNRLERAPSPEATSIRPNPFDDTDASSRKRRRTGSPSGEAEPIASALEVPAEPSNDSGGVDGANDNAIPSSTERGHHRQPSSSKVTINLRQASATSPTSEPSPSTSGPVQEHCDPSDKAPEAIHNSVEVAAEDLQTPIKDRPTAANSTEATRSPSADIMSVQDDQEAEQADEAPSDALSSHLDLDLDAPIPNFPFTNVGDELADTLRQVTNHVAAQSLLPLDVLAMINSWLAAVVPLMQSMDGRAIAHIWENSKFWHNLPELMHAVTSQTVTTSVLTSADARGLIIDFYQSFTMLSAAFVVYDLGTLSQFQSLADKTNTSTPELFTSEYFHFLHVPLGFEFPSSRSRDASLMAEVGRARHDMADHLLDVFRDRVNDGWGDLRKLVEVVADLLPTVPKWVNRFGPICQILDVLARHALRLEEANQGIDASTKPFDVIYGIWGVLDASIRATIEKRVTNLSSEAASVQLLSLKEVLKMYLLQRPLVAVDLYQSGSTQERLLSHGLVAEVVAWEWYLDRLGQLIRSSQMQLRVFAATSMCGTLVSLWKRFSESAVEEEKELLLNRIGSYLLQTNLISYLFGPSCHPEIIMESGNIVGFLVINKQYSMEHTEQLWQTITTTQDPRIAEALCRMITNITNLFDYDGLLGLCVKLQTLPLKSFTQATRQLWTTVLMSMVDKVKAGQAEMSFHPYQLCLKLLRESSVYTKGASVSSPSLQTMALKGLHEVLGAGDEETRRRHRQQLYLSCLEDLETKSTTTLGSLGALSLAMRPAFASEMSLLTEEHGLTRLIVEELHHAVIANRDADDTCVLYGPPNHPRREFVAQIIQLQPLTLEGKLGTRLWDVLVGHEAACQADRNAGWEILNASVTRLSLDNHYLSTCFTDRLPALPRECFCHGVLDFVRAQVIPLTRDPTGAFFEEDSAAGRAGLEQLWRIVTEAEDQNLADVAIHTLAVDVFLDSPLIQTFPVSRTRQIHSSVVTRCLQLLRKAASNLRSSSEADNHNGAQPAPETSPEQKKDSQRTFFRAIQLLVHFLAKYRSKPGFASPDLRSFMPEAPCQVAGDLTELKYQSFDGTSQTDVKPLNIGRLNTAASLLASLRQETGFDNYRAYFRGRPFVPTENDICKSLEDLQVREGLILVKKEQNEPKSPSRVKAGSSPLEAEISGYFDELQSYLDLAEPLAREVLNFLTMLPPDQHFMRTFEDLDRTHRDIFPPGHAFRTLYAVQTLMPYLDTVSRAALKREEGSQVDKFPTSSHSDAVRRCLVWVSDAISDETLTSVENPNLQFEVLTQLMSGCRQLLTVCRNPDAMGGIVHPTPQRLLEILSNALNHPRDTQVCDLVGHTMAAIFKLGLMSTSIWEKFQNTSGFPDLIQNLVLRESRQEMRSLMTLLIEETVKYETQEGSGAVASQDTRGLMTLFFWDTLSVLLEEAEDYAVQSYEFFKACTILLKRISASRTTGARNVVAKTAENLAHLLLRHESIEEPGRPEACDIFVHSVSSMLHFCLDDDNISTTLEMLPSPFAANLIDQHLFPRDRTLRDDPVARVILHPDTRKTLSEVVYRVVQHDRKALSMVIRDLDRLLPYYEGVEDVYLYDSPFGNFDRDKFIRAPCGYTGLRNLSNTCYLNSLMTQLFMNPRFRYFLLNARGDTTNRRPELLTTTQKLLTNLQESWRPFVDPEEFVSCLRTFEETPIDVHSQMDVDEFYNLLFDQWEGDLATPADKHQLRSFFGGQLVQQVKSKECEHISERLEPFSAIQCDIKGKGTLKASLQAYVDGEIMEGDNKYKCSTCDRHVDAVKRACLKDVPDNLIFHLKRFDFNLRTLQRSKINDYFSFPLEIDMAPYTIEHLSDPSSSEPDPFELVGVLVHSGTAESGHYYSYIKERPTSAGRPGWYEFNDEMVSQWDLNYLEHSTFGGFDYRPPEEPNSIKSYSAYMLFYQRASTLRKEQQNMTTRGTKAPFRVRVETDFKDDILADNTILLRRYCLFDNSHSVLVSRCIEEGRKADDDAVGLVRMREASVDDGSESPPLQTNHSLQSMSMRLALNYFDQVVVRAYGSPFFNLYQGQLQVAITTCTDCALVVLEYFEQRPEAFRSLLQRNQDAVIRRYSGEMLLSALQRVAEDRPWIYQPSAPLTPSSSSMTEGRSDEEKSTRVQASIPESMKIVLRNVWKGFQVSFRSWEEIFSFVQGFARLGHHEKAVLLADEWPLRVLRIIAADPASETRPAYLRMLQALSKRTRPPSYSAIISLISYLFEAMEPVIGAESIVEDASERLALSEPPFPWTSLEANLLLHHPRSRNASIFMEKLIALDQEVVVTDQILCRLMDAGHLMNASVFHTLRCNIPGEAAGSLMNPFLRAAACFVKNSESLELSRRLVFHVALQSRHLQHGEGLAFVEFFKELMSGGFANSVAERDIREKSLENVPNWAPALLVSFEPIVRQATSAFLDEQLFDVHSELSSQVEMDDDNSTEGQRPLQGLLREVVQNLGVNCLIYLRESHVKPQAPISRDAAESILRVITGCREFCGVDAEDSDMEHAATYRALYTEVMPALQPQIVDELDADVTDWDNSVASSEVGMNDHITDVA